QEFRDAFALGCRRLYHEGQINILALDLGMAPHMPPQTGMLREGTGLRRGDDGEAIILRKVGAASQGGDLQYAQNMLVCKPWMREALSCYVRGLRWPGRLPV